MTTIDELPLLEEKEEFLLLWRKWGMRRE